MVGKREAVLLLAEKLQAATRRGVTRAALLEALETKGLKVHIDLLREALKHVGKTSAQRQARAPRRARVEPAAAVDERADKNRATGGQGNAAEPERGPVDDGSPAGVTTSDNAGSPSEQSPDGGRTERRPAAAVATDSGPTERSERVGAGLGSAPASSKVAEPSEPRRGSKEPEGAVAGAGAARAAGPQSNDEVPNVGATTTTEAAVAASVGTSARQAEAGSTADGKSASAPAARGSFVPRSDSDNI
jgi:hypothetical protein